MVYQVGFRSNLNGRYLAEKGRKRFSCDRRFWSNKKAR